MSMNEDGSEDTVSGREWLPDDALEGMIMEKSFHPGESNPKTAKRLMDENAPVIAMSMIHLAIHSRSERTRLDAGRYIMDRILGRVGEELMPTEDSPIDKFISDVITDIEAVVGGHDNG